jgi:cyclic pyranopterin phosphate synthase
MAIDQYGRHIHYLRISLTDHCNLRCVYCMPEDMTFRPNAELMQDREIIILVKLFVQLGFDKFRLTGGEPTVRRHVVDLVREIAHTPGVNDLSMTTNGVLLSRLAKPLAEAGLQRVNISVDSLNPEKFHQLTRKGSLETVLAGIHAAEQAGLVPIKINAVVVRGSNETEVVDLARLTLKYPWQVRFIEMMPFASSAGFQTQQMVTSDEIYQRIVVELGPIEPTNAGRLDGEARTFRLPGAKGELGFIASVSHQFCASCTRARLTSDGHLRMCLLQEGEVDLLTPLRAGASQGKLKKLILNEIWNKPWSHGLSEGLISLNRVMSEIGG